MGLDWDVLFVEGFIKIGCELHSFDDWVNFTNFEIKKMHKNASTFWKKYGDFILETYDNRYY